MDDELKDLLEGMRRDNASMREENAAAHSETRRHFEIIAERLEKKFDVIAQSVDHLAGQLQTTRTQLEERIARTAAETQAMIKFSHVELDRRVRALEDSQRTLEGTVTDLQGRVERLESSAH